MASTFRLSQPLALLEEIGRTGKRWAAELQALARMAASQSRAVFPGHHMARDAAWCRVEPADGISLRPLLTRSGVRLTSLYAPAATPGAPTILFFYGNDMCLRLAMPVLQLLRTLGVNVLSPEYVGYGLSEGRPSESGCYATADAAYDFLLSRPEIDPKKIVVAGCSLGGAVAIDLAARRSVAGLATLVTFTSMKDMACRFYPEPLVRLVLKYRFLSEKKIRNVKCPILIGHSMTDNFVPYEMADRLAAAAGGPVSRLVIEGAEHNSAAVLARASSSILAAFDEFVGACTGTQRLAAAE